MANTDLIDRPAGRIVLVDDRDRILLIRHVSEDQEEPELWITPGGALILGESFEQAALRELWEETGLSGVELGPCVWTRRHVWLWGAEMYDSREFFYLIRTSQFTVVPAQLDRIEMEVIKEHRWWSVPEISAASGRETFVPRNLGNLLGAIVEGQIPSPPIDAGA